MWEQEDALASLALVRILELNADMKHLLHKHGDLSLALQCSHTSLAWLHFLYHSYEEAETSDPEGL